MGRDGPSEFFLVRSARRSRINARGLHPRIELALGFVAGNAVAILEPPDQLLGTPLNLIHIVVSELAPLFANLALQLHPLTLESVFVHRCPPPTFAQEGARLMPSPRLSLASYSHGVALALEKPMARGI